MPDEVQLDPMDAYNIAVTLTNLAQLINLDMESGETLTNMQFWALSSQPVSKANMDRQTVAGRLRDHVAVILGQLGDSVPEL